MAPASRGAASSECASLQRARNQRWRQFWLSSTSLLFDEAEQRIYSLDPLGSLIWERHERGDPLSQIAEELGRELGVENSIILKLANEYVDNWKEVECARCNTRSGFSKKTPYFDEV